MPLTCWLRNSVPLSGATTLAAGGLLPDGEKLVTAALLESVLSQQLDDLEATLTRHGYRLKDLVEQFDAKPYEIRALFSN